MYALKARTLIDDIGYSVPSIFYFIMRNATWNQETNTQIEKKKRISSPSVKISTFDNFHTLILKIKYIFGLLTYTGN